MRFFYLLLLLSFKFIGGYGQVADKSWYGTGRGDEFTLNTAGELYGFAELVNESESFKGKAIRLGQDIQLNDTTDWESWGGKTKGVRRWIAAGTPDTPFEGVFDGQGHTVSGLFLSTETNGFCQGFFGYISGAEIRNMTLSNSSVKGYNFVGAIAGYAVNKSQIINCHNDGIVSAARNFAGGVVGFSLAECLINGCSNGGNVSAGRNAGGIAGYGGSLNVLNSFNTGTITSRYENAGGLFGIFEEYSHRDDVIVANCYNTGTVRARDVVGGLVGYIILYDMTGRVRFANCYSAGRLISRYPVVTDGLIGCYTYNVGVNVNTVVMRLNRYADPCYWNTNSCTIQQINYPRFNKKIDQMLWVDFCSNQQQNPRKFLEITDDEMLSQEFIDRLNKWVDKEKKRNFLQWEKDNQDKNGGYPVLKGMI